MNIGDIQALLNNTSTIYTKIDVLPKVAGESIITLTNEDSIKSWTYNDFRNVEKQGFIGQFVARTLDGELQDISDDFNIEDREIILYLGINREHENTLVTQSNVAITNQSGESLITDIGEYETTYYKLGNFFVEKPNSDNVKDSTKYQSTDYTILFNQAFNPDYKSIAFPKSFNERLDDEESVTALWLTQYTCEQVGVELGSTNFDNKDFVLDSNQYDSDYTCRDVIKSIAKLAFTWARIGWDNKLYLDFTKQTQVLDYNIVTNDNYYTLNIQKEVYGEVNRVVTGSSVVVGNSAYVEDAQSIEDNGLTELDVYDNPILYTQELREQAIVAGNKLLGLTYQPIDMETTGHPWLLGNELIKVVDMEGNNLYTYPLDRTITFNGHIRTKINSVTKTQTQTSLAYQGVENESKQVRRSRVELDRQNQTFTVEIENLNNEMQDVTSQVKSVIDADNTVKGNPVNINDSGEFLIRNFSIYGNLKQGLLPEGYTQVDYIQNSGNVDINIQQSVWTMTIEFALTDLTTTQRFGSDGGLSFEYNTTDGLICHHGTYHTTLFSAEEMDTNKHKYFVDVFNNTIKIDDGEPISITWGVYGNNSFHIFAFSTTSNMNMKLYSLIAKDRTTTKIFIPCIDDNSIVGLYETNFSSFYTNTSTGTLINGNVINNYEIYGVEGNHSLSIESKNKLNLPDMSETTENYSMSSNDGIIHLTKNSSRSVGYTFNNIYSSLEPNTYTFSASYAGVLSGSYISISLWQHTTSYNQQIAYLTLTPTLNTKSVTINISDESDVYLAFSAESRAVCDDLEIKAQVEKGTESTDFSKFVEPQSYEYNLNNVGLYKINDYVDYIKYNLTDKKWYFYNYITKKNMANIIQTSGSSNDDNIVFKTYDSNYSDFGTTFKILSKDFPCYSNYFEWKGVATSDAEALAQGVGMYTNILNVNGKLGGVLYVVAPKTIATNTYYFKQWCENNNINVWYIPEEPTIEELQDYDLVEQLNTILEQGKLYETEMLVEDVATERGITGDIEVNYLTNTTFNGIYASRAELNITQNSIESTVSETFTTSVQPVIDSVDALGEQLQNTEANLQSNIDDVSNSLGNYALNSSLVTVTNTVSNIQTALNQQILVSKELQENGVTKVTTTTGFTFDENGLAITKTGADTKTVIDEDGMTVYSATGSSETPLLNVDSQGVDTENLHVRTYTQIGNHSRLQDYEDGTAIFYIA